jgi:cytidylate kinase
MYRIIGDRGSGKTSRLMLLAKETGAKIACSNPSAMAQKAYGYGITGIEFISYKELFNQYLDKNDKVLIDEIECFLNSIANGQMIGYTLSNED